ncbi:hypothetical protein Tsubulata_015874 [Turnera subulata]|uniref:Uncharacterized protein n=1 Tax=Turnera subulata TaxID=218843 RepID=A0A9Q0GKL9_9ROSI|nr:hypothetical protein Tsubulata_015874 [Turnera subulata]
MSTEKGVLEQATPGEKAKVGVQSGAAASAHFFHFDEGGIRAETAYAIGGNPLRGSPHPREVWICDMNGPRGPVEEGYAYVLAAAPVEVDVYPWRRGPDLIGPKPTPLVFAFRGKIYALSGGGTGTSTNPGPLFEVLDPEEQPSSWMPLPPPPDAMYHHPSPISTWSHLVLGNRLWVCARHGYHAAAEEGEEDINTFCYDLIKHEWVAVPYCDRPDGVKALCGLWPTPPHAVGGDIHYHAGNFYAVTREHYPDAFKGGLAACSADSLISSLKNGDADLKGTADAKKNGWMMRRLVRYLYQLSIPLPKNVAEPVLFECPADFGTGFTEAILYPPETEEGEGDDPVFRMLFHYQDRDPLLTEYGGAPWGTLVLLTFSLDGMDAYDVSTKLWFLPHHTGTIGGRPSILFKAYCEPPPPPPPRFILINAVSSPR